VLAARKLSRELIDRRTPPPHIKLRRDRVPSFETYPFSLPAVKELGTLKLHPNVTIIVGENGNRRLIALCRPR
jgi:hypothetical protein